MIKVTVTAKSRSVLIELGKSSKKISCGIRQSFFEIGRENQRFLRKRISQKDKTGRIYRIKGKDHKASSFRDFPAGISGLLSRGVGYELRGSDSLEFGVEAEYGKFLEEGTRKMKPRRLVLATVNAKQRDTMNSFLRHTDREIKK